jgi:hypothetical protein
MFCKYTCPLLRILNLRKTSLPAAFVFRYLNTEWGQVHTARQVVMLFKLAVLHNSLNSMTEEGWRALS